MSITPEINRQRTLKAAASTWLVLKAALKSFGANRNLEIAATLAFYGFLSLMPLLLMTIILLGAFLRSSDAVSHALTHVLTDIFPAFQEGLLADLHEITGGGALSLISAGLLMWSMTPLSGALRTALARMFKTPIQRPFLKSKIVDLVAVLAFLVLFLILVSVKIVIPEAASAWLTLVAGTILPFVLTTAFIGLFFRVFSPVRLTWRQWLLGAVFVTLLWAVMRNLFVVFVQYNPNYGYAFGSLKAIFLLIAWVYYSFAALLFGAEVMANTYRRDALLLRELLEKTGKSGPADSVLMRKFARDVAAGCSLFREGDAGDEMFVVLDGAMKLSREGRELAVMKQGDYFGEMSLLSRAPRSASATALVDSRLAVINQGNFDLLVRENPVLVRGLLEELARRLAETNRKLNRS
ncbi:MAG TPA: YhjD/YihY/BrkB family envelope integrity protein [Kiritimatiellia bacterium]|nr:YhjD/YihY/BrkB family envelope integrity protein [Kiritimatiellia bacterium]